MIPTHPFGRTGHQSTLTIFGAAAFSRVSQEDADRTMETIMRYGVNHIDTAASYGDSELRLGPWMDRHRSDFFLASKTGDRTYQGARDSIRRSLERLRVTQIDLIQLHNLADPSEWDIAMGPGGALEAAIEARQEGLVRFIGVTGHGTIIPTMHLKSLTRFDFDSVLLPYSHVMMQNAAYATDYAALMARCKERNVAVQTIKSITRAPWTERPGDAPTWYEPLRDQADIDRAVHWVLGQPGAFLNTAGDIALLPKILDAATTFQSAPTDADMADLARQREMAPLFV